MDGEVTTCDGSTFSATVPVVCPPSSTLAYIGVAVKSALAPLSAVLTCTTLGATPPFAYARSVESATLRANSAATTVSAPARLPSVVLDVTICAVDQFPWSEVRVAVSVTSSGSGEATESTTVPVGTTVSLVPSFGAGNKEGTKGGSFGMPIAAVVGQRGNELHGSAPCLHASSCR